MRMGLEQDWRGLLRSIATYSRIPLKIDWDSPVKHTPSVCFLPWVGAIVALLSAWPLWFSSWSSEFQALLMLISAVLITGAFHEDGLMDACDGLVGGWTPEQRLTIMKDSRVGSYGVLAAVFSFAMKWWLLSQWLASGAWHLDEYSVLAGWIALHVAARWLPLWVMRCANYVSQGGSKARSMLSPMTKRAWLWVILSMVFVWCLVGGSAFARIILALIVCFLAGLLYLKRKIQGYNGDTLGAIEQLGEIAVLFSLLAWQA